MCDSPSENAGEATIMPRKRKYDRTKLCVKCKANTGNVVIRHSVYCKSCFGPLIDQKLTKALDTSIDLPGQYGPVLPLSSLLIGFSGGPSSSALLDLVANNYLTPKKNASAGSKKPQSRRERVWGGRAYVGYVELCAAYEGRKDYTDEIRALINKYHQYTFIPLRIEQAFDPSWWTSLGMKPPTAPHLRIDLGLPDLPIVESPTSSPETHPSPTSVLRAFLSSLPTHTARTSALSHLTRLILLHTASSLTSSSAGPSATSSSTQSTTHLLLGTSLTSLSINLINTIAFGGGYALQEEQEETWNPPSTLDVSRSSVKVIRPLRDVTAKECAVYSWWNHTGVLPGGITLKEGRHGSGSRELKGKESERGIEELTRDFIISLDRDFPSTVSTISRTIGKVGKPQDRKSDQQNTLFCAFCSRPRAPNVADFKAQVAIRSRPSPDTSDSALKSPSSVSLKPGMEPYLCYSCHTAFVSRGSKGSASTGKSSPVTMPMWVSVPAAIRAPSELLDERKSAGHAGLKAQIKDFLLDEDE